MPGPVLTSTTSTKEEMEHALSPEWRDAAALPEAPKPEVDAPEGEEPETAAAPEPAEETESKPKEPAKRKSGWEKRIDKLTARNYQLEKELEEARKAPKPTESKETAAPQGPPKLDDFLKAGKTADEWADARDTWKADQAEKQSRAEDQKAVFDEYNRGVSEARGKHDDWDEVIQSNPDTEIPQSVNLAIIEMGKQGPEVAYYLGKHPEVCDELMDMRPLAAAARVHEIAKELIGGTSRSSPQQKPRATPPAPIETVGASTTRSSVPLDQLPIKEYMKVRNQQERRRR